MRMIRFLKSEEGATAIEYGLIASLIAVAIVGVLLTLGPALSGVFQHGSERSVRFSKSLPKDSAGGVIGSSRVFFEPASPAFWLARRDKKLFHKIPPHQPDR